MPSSPSVHNCAGRSLPCESYRRPRASSQRIGQGQAALNTRMKTFSQFVKECPSASVPPKDAGTLVPVPVRTEAVNEPEAGRRAGTVPSKKKTNEQSSDLKLSDVFVLRLGAALFAGLLVACLIAFSLLPGVGLFSLAIRTLVSSAAASKSGSLLLPLFGRWCYQLFNPG